MRLPDSTVIAVASRPSLIAMADQIMFFDQGVIYGPATHIELLVQNVAVLATGRQLKPGADEGGVRPFTSITVELSPEDYLATLQKLTFYTTEQSLELLSGAPPALGQDALRLVTTLQTMGLIKAAPDWRRLLAPEPARRLKEVAE